MSYASGEIVRIPSPIDVHAHLREPGGEEKETIASGTLAALAGGYQAVFDMPNNPGGNETRTEEKFDQKVGIAQETAHTMFGAYAGVDLENPAFEEFPALVSKAAGLKLYMGPTTGNAKNYDLDVARPSIDAWIDEASKTEKRPPILLHAIGGIGVDTAQYIIDKNYPVHWCHVSTAEETVAASLLTKIAHGLFTAGVTPHHLTMTERNANFQQGWHGARMQPPLGKEVDAEALLFSFNKGYLQILETDHAPHTHDQKLTAEVENPNGHTEADCTTCYGISGIEFVLPVMMSLVQRKIISMERLVDALHAQPARMLGLDALANGSQTELEIGPRVLGENDVVGASGNHPYYGWTGWAKVLGVSGAIKNQGKIIAYGSRL